MNTEQVVVDFVNGKRITRFEGNNTSKYCFDTVFRVFVHAWILEFYIEIKTNVCKKHVTGNKNHPLLNAELN